MPLRGKKLLITSGPTRTPLDAVRYITNKATGRLGALIAEEVIRRGALVTFVYGRGSQTPVLRGPRLDHLQLVPIETVDDLITVFRQELPKHYDALIHPMAVLDFRPDTVRPYKTGSHVEEWIVRLVPRYVPRRLQARDRQNPRRVAADRIRLPHPQPVRSRHRQ